MRLTRPLSALMASSLLVACTPALDWRSVTPPVPGLQALLPCRPAQATRELALAGTARALSMWHCEAEGTQWAIAAVAGRDDADAQALATALGQSLWANLGEATPPPGHPWALRGPGATVIAQRQDGTGHDAHGRALQASVLLASSGRWAWRVSAWREAGPPPPAHPDPAWGQAVQTLFEGLGPSATTLPAGSEPTPAAGPAAR